MHDFIPYLAARDRTAASAQEALPNSPVLPEQTNRHIVRLRFSALLYRIAGWLEPGIASERQPAGKPCASQRA